MIALTRTFMSIEVVGSLRSGSRALLADAARKMTAAGGLELDRIIRTCGNKDCGKMASAQLETRR